MSECIVLEKIELFEENNGIKIGMSKKKIIGLLGKNYTSKDNCIMYLDNDDENSSFLANYGMPEYFGQYCFENSELIEFKFGFTNP